jgi:hypothetical protein
MTCTIAFHAYVTDHESIHDAQYEVRCARHVCTVDVHVSCAARYEEPSTCRWKVKAEEQAETLRSKLAAVGAELNELRAASKARESAMEQQMQTDARRLQAQAELADRELAQAKEQLRLQEAKVKEQLVALSYKHTKEVTHLRQTLQSQLDAAEQQNANDALIIQDTIQTADQIAADVSCVDKHLHKVGHAQSQCREII